MQLSDCAGVLPSISSVQPIALHTAGSGRVLVRGRRLSGTQARLLVRSQAQGERPWCACVGAYVGGWGSGACADDACRAGHVACSCAAMHLERAPHALLANDGQGPALQSRVKKPEPSVQACSPL